MANMVFIGMSIDGYIADRNGGLDWLQMIPNPENLDLGYGDFMTGVDAMVMGRNTYEVVESMDIEWPYSVPTFVCSRSLKEIPIELAEKVSIINGTPEQITSTLNKKGFENLYIDGGRTIQGFLSADLIDELIITKIPVLLGGGTRLFGSLPEHRAFSLISTETLLDELVVTHYRRKV